ncbi:MAG TPA: lytic transglycosylase domain-containing protein [Gemmatimonadaceae bacterium]|jgi:soluble lytic murein transglycosylase-like protein|nr:lytic transglycosylase domain-containing protein [Gemmatimonadaceae bacterium]
MKRLAVIAGFGLAAAVLLLLYPSPAARMAQAAVLANRASSAPLSQNATLRSQLAASRGQLSALQAELRRTNEIIAFSSRFGVPAGLTADVYDAAIKQRIDPELAFRLVKLESDFNPHAISSAGALGLTQLMPATARFYDRHLRDDQLFDPKINLSIGFRYLHSLVAQYPRDIGRALLIYNRGGVAVQAALAQGQNPTNGYDRILLKGYRGPGILVGID